MAVSKRRTPRQLAKAAKGAAKKAHKKAVKPRPKPASKKKAKKQAARGAKPARRIKAVGASARDTKTSAKTKRVLRPDPKSGSKPGSKSGSKSESKSESKSGPKASARRPAYRDRPLLASVRRPKAVKPRGPSRARVRPRRRPVGPNGANGAAVPRYDIRDFMPEDASAVNAVALAAFEQYRGEYSDWPDFARQVGAMASLAESGEIVVALSNGRIAGAVAYFGPHAVKPAMFDPAWPVIRMLVVDPSERGQGLGRALTEECIRRARRDGASQIALHTSPIMQVALAMYLRQGFVPLRETTPLFGVPYCIYLKSL